MNLEILTSFFMWCTIINGVIYLYSVAFICSAPNFIYRIQSKIFSIPRETFDVILYSYLALYKVLFIVFCLVPWLALLIMN